MSGLESSDIIVIIFGIVGILFAVYQYYQVAAISFDDLQCGGEADVKTPLAKPAYYDEENAPSALKQKSDLVRFYTSIQNGAKTFLFAEYLYCAVFIVLFYLVILVLISWGNPKVIFNKTTMKLVKTDEWDWAIGALTATSFAVGAITSLLSGYIGMMVATFSNARTTVAASYSGSKGWTYSFNTAFQAGGVMGFALCSLALLMLFILLHVYRPLSCFTMEIAGVKLFNWTALMDCIAGYGLGGSSIAMFGRVGGGIYTKAADVGSDLAGKVHKDLPEDDPRNPGVIADNVGDNVGDVAGMGSDLFGSFGEATCAALLVGASAFSNLKDGQWNALIFPLLISAVGIPVCLVTSFFATHIMPVKKEKDVETALKWQLGISTILMTAVLYPLCHTMLPPSFDFPTIADLAHNKTLGSVVTATPKDAFLCVCFGLWGGCVIGFITEYFTSHSWQPTRDVAASCETGAATNIIYGLALGYKSVILPVFILAATIYGSFILCAMYGIALSALGMLATLATCLSIDVYGPVCDNAGGIAEMSELHHSVRDKTDALDAAGNTTAAIGKGFAIGSAALVSLALFGAFVTRTSGGGALRPIDILNPITFAGLLVGAMLPYWFTAMTMKSVGTAASAMVNEIKRQWQNPDIFTRKIQPDFQKCIDISTKASLSEMIAPGALVMLSPIVAGLFFGIDCVCGLLAGGLVSGVQMAISQSNTGGAWDNAKKYIGSKRLNRRILEREGGNPVVNPKGLTPADIAQDEDDENIDIKHKASEFYKAAVTGDTVGDPLKDTSGPALNILMKLMAIVSVVFAGAFLQANHGKGFFSTGSQVSH